MAYRYQNRPDTTDRVPSYYVNNGLYPRAYARNDYPTRTSRRIHDGLSLDRNFGLDTTSDDLNASPYSSPYYVNGRYNSNDLTTQTGNSASVQGTSELLTLHDEYNDFTDEDIETTILMWQGKQIKFQVPYDGKVVGATLTLRNRDNCRGILSIYLSATEDGPVLAEMAIDLCTISQDDFEHVTLHTMTPVPHNANPRGNLFVRLEIWDEVSCERSTNPFNTYKKIEIAGTGHGNQKVCINYLNDKNTPVEDTYEYKLYPSRPLLGLIYNEWHSIPCIRNEGVDFGAKVSKDGYSYDIYAISNNQQTQLVIYDPQTNKTVPNSIPVDARATQIALVQGEDYVYYVDGYSPLQRFQIGTWSHYSFPASTADSVEVTIDLDTWASSGIAPESGEYRFVYNGSAWEYQDKVVTLSTYGITIIGTPSLNGFISVIYNKAGESTPADVDAKYTDTRPVVAPSIIVMHHNRIYLSGFRYDPNLVQCSQIVAAGPDFNSYPYRFYSPGQSPLSTSTNPISAIVEYESDTLMITTTGGYALYQSNVNLENGTPQQVSTYSDGAGVASSGDIVSYRGVVYSFDPDEGIRRFTGSIWNAIPATVDAHIARVDMSKPRKLWGYAYKLYFNYTDSLDHQTKCLVWDMDMNYNQYPWFQDTNIPFCDVRTDNEYNIRGIHPDFPCIMRLYDSDVWRRLDSPINFERHTKYMSLPGNAADLILKRVHNKVIANSDRWWYFALSIDVHSDEQARGNDVWYRMPCWATKKVEQPTETPFPNQDIYEENSTALLTLPELNAQAISVQEKIKCKTFRNQANLISTLFECGVRAYN